MRRYKILIVLIALILGTSIAIPMFAATGYGPGAQPSVPSFVPTLPGTRAQIVNAATTAIQQSLDAGHRHVNICIVNIDIINAEYVRYVFNMAYEAGLAATVHVCTRVDNNVITRKFINAQTAAELRGTIDFTMQVSGDSVNETATAIRSMFTNNVAVILNGHNGTFGRGRGGTPTRLRTAAMIDLTGLDTNNLRFYAFNDDMNIFTLIHTPFGIDSQGFLHFFMPVGGPIIVTDSPLTRARR